MSAILLTDDYFVIATLRQSDYSKRMFTKSRENEQKFTHIEKMA